MSLPSSPHDAGLGGRAPTKHFGHTEQHGVNSLSTREGLLNRAVCEIWIGTKIMGTPEVKYPHAEQGNMLCSSIMFYSYLHEIVRCGELFAPLST